MKKSSLSFGLIIFVVIAKAQSMFLQDINGQPIFENAYSAIEGTPYLNADWTRGTVKAKHNGKTYELAKTRYDAYKDELEYEENQKPYRFGKEITEFTSDGKLFRSGFTALDNLTLASFYEVIYDGKVKLLKRYPTRIQSEKPYNSATEIRRFVKEEAFFLYKDHKTYRLKKDKKSLLEALGDKQADLEAFIKDQKLKLSKEEDILKVIEKYEQ